MHQKVRLKKRAVETNNAIEILKKSSYGVLSTIGKNGFPYGVPINYTYWNNYICFHCAQRGHKLENINFSNKVSFCVVAKSDVLPKEFDTDYQSAIAFGLAFEVTNSSEKKDILMSIINKYSPDYLQAGKLYMEKYWDESKVIKIEIKHITGKTNI